MSIAANAALVEPWKDLWNGDLSITDKIIAEDFVAHAAPMTGTGPDQIRGREALNRWISGIHAILPDLVFSIDVGPIADEDHMVVRWRARGTYRGGWPGTAPEAVGREITFTGTDTLRVAGSQFVEYWANADSLLFYQELGIREVPPGMTRRWRILRATSRPSCSPGAASGACPSCPETCSDSGRGGRTGRHVVRNHRPCAP